MSGRAAVGIEWIQSLEAYYQAIANTIYMYNIAKDVAIYLYL